MAVLPITSSPRFGCPADLFEFQVVESKTENIKLGVVSKAVSDFISCVDEHPTFSHACILLCF